MGSPTSFDDASMVVTSAIEYRIIWELLDYNLADDHGVAMPHVFVAILLVLLAAPTTTVPTSSTMEETEEGAGDWRGSHEMKGSEVVWKLRERERGKREK